MDLNVGRECAHCGKQTKSYRGLNYHLRQCAVLFHRTARKRARRTAPAGYADSGLDVTVNGSRSVIDDGTWEDIETIVDDGHVLDELPPADTEAHFNVSPLASPEPDRAQSDGSIPHRGGLLSTASSMRVKNYTEVTGRTAGSPIHNHDDGDGPSSASNDERSYHPFTGAIDYGLALWFHDSKLSKGAVDRFFADRRLGALHELISFRNADGWMDMLHNIPHGIPNEAWTIQDMRIESGIVGVPPSRYSIQYRDITKVLEFLIGHPPFKEHLTYVPSRHYNLDDQRIYNEMHTGDWWWRTQDKLPTGATVLPLLLATDKTMLTQHHGDESAWPVYLTIGNLDRTTRRKQTRPGTVLLGFLPIVSEKEEGLKSEVYHTAMGIILKPLERHAKEGIPLRCADGCVRQCYPIIAGFMTDYEEQVLITYIKSGRQCAICQVPPHERENLCGVWPPRTHESTRSQLVRQDRERWERTRDDWIHPVANFAWKHHHVNIHGIMMVDVLHQLLKGIIMHLIQWTQTLLTDVVKPTRKRRRNQTSLIVNTPGWVQLDHRFRQVPHYTGLKRFTHFSEVKQWTGVEQKAIIHQFIPVVAPLLTAHAPAALHCARAIIDFVIMARYRTHDEDTVRYMSHALYRVDKLKEVFRQYRPQDRRTEEGHFNFPKFHAITHYVDFIREFGSTDGFDTSHSEAAHRYLVKAFYGRTNKRDDYLEQILKHNTRRLNVLAMEDILTHGQSVPRSMADIRMQTLITRPSRPMNLEKLRWRMTPADRTDLRAAGLDPKRWRRASFVAAETGIEDLLPALAAFTRESRIRLDGVTPDESRLDRREPDPNWIGQHFVAVHASIKCWKRGGKDSDDPEALTEESVRCSPAWQGRVDNWRQDYVWVQEREAVSNSHNGGALDGKLLGQLQLVVTIIDHERRDALGKPHVYAGALVEIWHPRNRGLSLEIHGMVEVERWPESRARQPRNLGQRRFYGMSTILRSAHVIPARDKVSYVNNYIDWDQYNTLYEPDFLNNGTRIAERFVAQVPSRGNGNV
ncbi:MAG: hypothetical protein M1837_001836 [Sclerophora amabilis]|nr:MAG: hypothetical protein M1837_001836 [Sclerophora amabilis]